MLISSYAALKGTRLSHSIKVASFLGATDWTCDAGELLNNLPIDVIGIEPNGDPASWTNVRHAASAKAGGERAFVDDLT